MDRTGTHGKYWYDASISKDFLQMLDYQREVFDYISNFKKYKAGSAFFLVKDTYEEISIKFPLLEEFRSKYNLEKRLTYLVFNSGKLYEHLPHDHESISSSIFFPLYYSDYVGTAFYEPSQDQLIEVRPSVLGEAIGDPVDKPRYTCSLEVTPVEVVGGNRPLIYKTSQLHTPIEIEKGHPENYTRVTCAWDSKYPFEKMIELL